MALHYHGLPITPAAKLDALMGKHVCISFATARASNISWALQHAQSILWDNGAFSTHRSGTVYDAEAFYRWVEPFLVHPHWAVIPDVIDGDELKQEALLKTWGFSRNLGAPVWHLHESLNRLRRLTAEWPRVCLGSSGQYWSVGSTAWKNRMDEAFTAIQRENSGAWIHGLRMLSQIGKQWPLASADSVNVARNAHRGYCPGCKSHRIDVVNGPLFFAYVPKARLTAWRKLATAFSPQSPSRRPLP